LYFLPPYSNEKDQNRQKKENKQTYIINHFAARFIVTCKHAAQHHKVRTSAERFGNIARDLMRKTNCVRKKHEENPPNLNTHLATAVGHDPTMKPVCGIGAFHDGRQLRNARKMS
jgi:hypothetical protein